MLALGLNIWQPALSAKAATGGIIAANRVAWLAKGTASGASWPDSSGNGNNLTLVNSPTVGATSVTFNGTNQYATFATLPIGVGYTVYMRIKAISWISGAYIIGGPAGRDSLRQMTASPTIACDDQSASGPQASVSLPVNGVNHSLVLLGNGGAPTLGVDGTEASGTLDGIGTGGSKTIAAIGGGASGFANIELTEYVAYSASHTPSERAQMLAYLNTR